jgi:hypothetical protein
MRPRFTIRLALVSIAILAASSYVLFVRPSNLAQEFVNAVNQRDYSQAESLLKTENSSPRSLFTFYPTPVEFSKSTTMIYAEVLPREWRDIWSFQRRFILRVAFKDTTNGRLVEWVEDTQMVAFIDGVDLQRN